LCFSVFSDWVWPEMKKVTGDGDPQLGHGQTQPLPVSSLVGHASLVVSSLPEEVGSLVLCLGLSSVLSLFCQNKLSDVSLYGWMLQKTSFADGPHGRGSQFKLLSFYLLQIVIIMYKL
jgi:hypothetical protein